MLLLGLVFMFSSAYLGFAHPYTKLYFGTGVICFLWSLWVITMRLRHREPKHQRDERFADENANAEQDAGA